MDIQELKLMWLSTHDKMEESMRINSKNEAEITKIKMTNFISSMKPIKIIALVIGVVWVVAIGSLLVSLILNGWQELSLFFLFSAILQVLLTAIAIIIYIRQIDLIHKMDFSESVVRIQYKLNSLKTSTLNVTRILFLQLPLWTTFYWSENMFRNTDLFWLLFQAFVTLAFAFTALWLFFNIKFENRNKKWFKLIFNGKEWQPILQSMELLDQVTQYREE